MPTADSTGTTSPDAASDLDETLERMQADGRIGVEDADAVRNFASFLHECGPHPNRPGFDAKRFGDAYREHYPEDYAQAIAERAARMRLIPEADA